MAEPFDREAILRNLYHSEAPKPGFAYKASFVLLLTSAALLSLAQSRVDPWIVLTALVLLTIYLVSREFVLKGMEGRFYKDDGLQMLRFWLSLAGVFALILASGEEAFDSRKSSLWLFLVLPLSLAAEYLPNRAFLGGVAITLGVVVSHALVSGQDLLFAVVVPAIWLPLLIFPLRHAVMRMHSSVNKGRRQIQELEELVEEMASVADPESMLEVALRGICSQLDVTSAGLLVRASAGAEFQERHLWRLPQAKGQVISPMVEDVPLTHPLDMGSSGMEVFLQVKGLWRDPADLAWQLRSAAIALGLPIQHALTQLSQRELILFPWGEPDDPGPASDAVSAIRRILGYENHIWKFEQSPSGLKLVWQAGTTKIAPRSLQFASLSDLGLDNWLAGEVDAASPLLEHFQHAALLVVPVGSPAKPSHVVFLHGERFSVLDIQLANTLSVIWSRKMEERTETIDDIMQESHDTTTPELMLAHAYAEAVGNALRRGDTLAASDTVVKLLRVIDLARSHSRNFLATGDVRITSPEQLVDQLYIVAQEAAETYGQVIFTVVGTVAIARLEGRALKLIYRFCREAIRNSFKHAQATRINLEFERQPDCYVVRVIDDGKGLEVPTKSTNLDVEHKGLLIMDRAAKQLGGTFHVEPGGFGTTIVLRLRDLETEGATDRR